MTGVCICLMNTLFIVEGDIRMPFEMSSMVRIEWRFESMYSIILATDVLIMSSFLLRFSEAVNRHSIMVSWEKNTVSLICSSKDSAYLSKLRISLSNKELRISNTFELLANRVFSSGVMSSGENLMTIRS